MRVLIQNMTTNGVCIITRCLTDSTIIMGMSHCWQCLNHQPSRVVRIFDGQFCILARAPQCSQVNSLCTRLCLCEWNGLGNAFLVGQDGQVMLFAVTKVLAANHHLCNQQTICFVIAFIGESNAKRTVCSKRYILFLSIHNLQGLGINQLQASLTANCIISSIHNTCRDSSMVTFTNETRNIRHNHHILTCHSLILQETGLHVLRMSHTHKAPSGQALRKSKLHCHPTLAIRHQLRIEECRFLQIFTHLCLLAFSRFYGQFFFRTIIVARQRR